MYREKKIGLVIPYYNEEKLIRSTLENVPQQIDRVFVVDDGSTDNMGAVVKEVAAKDTRIEYVRHDFNQGPGQAVITGYKWASEKGCEIVVVISGDGRMSLEEVDRFLDPVIDGEADYTKGNRFLALEKMNLKITKTRILGKIIITALTKMASGYYKIMDVVDEYTAITKDAVDRVNWDKARKQYDYPMDFLIRMNAYGLRVKDIPRTPIYLEGAEQSQVKGLRYALRVSPMLVRGFFWRMFFKYLYLDFHPLFFFYMLGLLFIPFGIMLGFYQLYLELFASGATGPMSILCALTTITGLQFLLFGMWFDMEVGKG